MALTSRQLKTEKERTAKHACKQMFGKVERRMPSARKWSENWKPKAGKCKPSAKCCLITPNNEQWTTGEQRRQQLAQTTRKHIAKHIAWHIALNGAHLLSTMAKDKKYIKSDKTRTQICQLGFVLLRSAKLRTENCQRENWKCAMPWKSDSRPVFEAVQQP